MSLVHSDYDAHVHSFGCGCWFRIDDKGTLHLYPCENPGCHIEEVMTEMADEKNWDIAAIYDG